MKRPSQFLSALWRAIAWFLGARRRPTSTALMITAAIIGAALVVPSVAMQGDTIADRVLGQVDLVHNGVNLVDAHGMFTPQIVAVDTTVTPNRRYVSDNANNRVLGYKDVSTLLTGGAPTW